MLSEVLSSINGVTVFPIASLIVFLVAFVMITIWVLRLDKQIISETERLPLDTSSKPQEDGYHG